MRGDCSGHALGLDKILSMGWKEYKSKIQILCEDHPKTSPLIFVDARVNAWAGLLRKSLCKKFSEIFERLINLWC